ncbi:MAG TPA: FHA domain-containing protein [Thermoanaerobaculia bacterium]|nr:FHA domain-containing protein [Thermoanaerobaculia bacterium]
MEIHIQHVSGSKAGLEQTFAPGAVRMGREQSNDVAFDPYQDLLVSGRHAEIAYDGRQWVLRDLGSANGTFIGEERITVRPLTSGETIQLGRGGPRLQVKFKGAAPPPVVSRPAGAVDNPGTRVMSIDDLVAGNQTSGGTPVRRSAPPAADGTVMMSRSEVHPARLPIAKPAGRSSSPLRIVLLVAACTVFVGIVAVLLFVKPSKKTDAGSPTAASAEVETLRRQLAANEAQLAELQRLRAQTTETGGVITDDLERQYANARATIDALKVELEQKNDEVRTAESKPARVVVKYVPVAVPAPAPQERQSVPVVESHPAPVAQPVQELAPPAVDVPASVQRPAVAVSNVPVESTRRPVETRQPVSSAATRTAPEPAALAHAAPAADIPPMKLSHLKRLRRRVMISGVASEIPFPDAPRNLSAELAKSIGASLTSSSEFFVDRTNGAVVRVTPTLFRSVEKKSDTNGFVNKVRGAGAIFGSPIGSVKVPVRGRSVSYDAALSAQVSVETANGRVLARNNVSSSLTDRRSAVEIVPAKTAFGELLNQDAPQADVMRSVVAQAVDNVMRALANSETEISVKSVRGQVVTLDAGRNANIAPDDVFDVLDGEQVVGRLGIESVQDGTATGRLITGNSTPGKRVRYAGTDVANGEAMPHSSVRFATVRVQTEAKDAPGTSFKTVSVVRPGARLNYVYSVGTWSKVMSGDTSLWVPTMNIEVQ